MAVDTALARKMWRTLEPFHGMIYFAPEAAAVYQALGIGGQAGYFASRAAPMGAVPAEVVFSTFYNFNPEVVAEAIPAAWATASPAELVSARFQAVDQALRRIIGDAVDGPEVAEALELVRVAAAACRPDGRALYAGHAALAWPGPAHLALWHAVTLVREFRGDGHIAALVAEGVSGLEALVIHGATGDVPVDLLQSTRAWPAEAWQAAVASLRERGWIDGDGALTEAGRTSRQWVEDRTDAAALAPWQALGQDGCDRLRTLIRPFSKAVVEAGTFGR